MPTVSVFDKEGKKLSDLGLSEAVFGIVPNEHAMHMAVVNYLANRRQGTQSTLTRSEVSGGGKKPWKQKGSGRARQGSTRAPQWMHGGIAHGPKPRSYRFRLNKKVRRLAMKSAMSAKVADGEMLVLDSFAMDEIKTKDAAAVLKNLNTARKTLIVLAEKNDIVYKSARNIDGVKVSLVNTLNTYDLLNCDSLVVVGEDTVKKIEEVYA